MEGEYKKNNFSYLMHTFHSIQYWTQGFCLSVLCLFVMLRPPPMILKRGGLESSGQRLSPQMAKLSKSVFIPSPVREGSTFLVITGVKFFRTKLKSVRKVSADANLKRFQHKVL